MKKTLALVLSVMMVLSLFVGMFSFTASAAEKGYAETEADKLWAEANKATSITINVNGKLVDIDAAVTNQKLADLYKDVELIAEANKATQSIKLAGSFSFDGNGTLILKGASAMKTTKYPGTEYTDWTRDILLINANGGLKVVLEDDFGGSIRGLDYTRAEQIPQTLTDGTPVLNEDGTPKMTGKPVQVPAKSHLIVTGDANWNMIGNSIGWDNGSVVIYGDITLTSLLADVRKSETDGAANTGAYDCIILRDNTNASKPHKQDGWDLILAPKYADLSGATGGAPVENRSGSTYICDNAYVVLGSNNSAFKITNTAKAGSKLVVRDNAVLIASGTSNVLNLDYGAAKAGYVIQDNAFVSVTGTAVGAWGASMIGAGLDMTGGTLVVDGTAVASATASTALNIQCAESINLAGGKVHVTMKPAADSTANTRMYAFFIKDIGTAGVNFTGAEIYLKVDTIAGNDLNAAISTQITKDNPVVYDINMTAGKLTIDAGANSHVYLPALNPSKFNITGGDVVINGGKSAIYVGALNNEFNVGDAANVKITSPKGLWRDDAPIAVNGITLDNNAAAVTKGNAVAVSATAPVIPAKPADKPNPPTSDFVVAPFVAVAMIAVVASAAIVLRKKVNG